MQPRRAPKLGRAERRILSWNRYWRHTKAPSAPLYAAGDPSVDFVESRIAASARQFGGSPRILDIGAGRGFLTGWIRRVLPRADVHTTDAADIAPLEHPEKHIRAPAERLPHASDSFNIIMSTFAMDYTQRELFAGEMRRVLKKGGTAVLLLHHPQSTLLKAMQIERQCILSELVYLRRFRKYTKTGSKADFDGAINALKPLRELKEISGRFGGGGPEETEAYMQMLATTKAAKEQPKPGGKEMEKKRIAGIGNAIREVASRGAHTRFLLRHRGAQLFASEAEMRQFFEKHGFAVLETTVIREGTDSHIRLGTGRAVGLGRKGDPRAYGIVLKK